MQLGIYFDQTRCSGCFTCMIACKDWHDIPAGPASRLLITTREKGQFPHLSVSHLFNACCHCAEPSCVAACPAGALTKRAEDGIVVMDKEACISCGACAPECPYGAIRSSPERMEKCDLCLDRWAEGLKPVCVESCPTRALDAGPLGELRAKYGQAREAEGFTYSEKNRPSIIFKPKRG